MSIHFGNPSLFSTFKEIVPLYSTKEFQSPTRSTIPMLSMLVHQQETFTGIIEELGMPIESDIYLEYTVRQDLGKGNASHTDVMVKSSDETLAIEAKWTEPMYDTVRQWIPKGKDEANRRLVLDGWLQLLQQRVEKELKPADFESSIYQMVHRAASAAAAGENPRLAYFIFKPSPTPRAATADAIKQQLELLWSALGSPSNFPFYVIEITVTEEEAYQPLKALPKNEETSEAVSAALQGDSPLFGFEASEPAKIGGVSA
ncbi:DUF6946 family protein [Bremerella sp. T1]|uniref:DUF6946 family protein n=1 Tax=Bremerella sp. TYQ1 TaxID=3119568 RepID=UPI001CCB8BB8|nr:hypothetical protein [Bremerella volcania]UBM35329.1 hypothetical protein LA756_21960 [Bremerella volcania]